MNYETGLVFVLHVYLPLEFNYCYFVLKLTPVCMFPSCPPPPVKCIADNDEY